MLKSESDFNKLDVAGNDCEEKGVIGKDVFDKFEFDKNGDHVIDKDEYAEGMQKVDKYLKERADTINNVLDEKECNNKGAQTHLPEKNIKDFARLYKAYKSYITEGGIGAVSSRCWPDFFTSFGTPVCMVLSLLNAMQVPASCEADVYGALSMYIGTQFTGQSTFFGDPVAMDEKEGTITYWHCGMAACDLARCDTGAHVGVHPNRKIGPVMDFGCKSSEEATIFRIGRKPDGTFRFMIAEGEVLDKPKQFNGTSIVVKTDTPSDEIIRNTIKNGWEPHYVVVYKRIGNELEKLAHMLDLEIERY